MNHTHYLKYLTLKRLVGLLFILLYLIFVEGGVAVASVRYYNVRDRRANRAINTMVPVSDRLAKTSKSNNDLHEKVNVQLTKADNSLQNIDTQYKKNIDLAIAWNKDTDPNLVKLKALLEPTMKAYQTLDKSSKIDLDKYEEKSFFNSEANTNRNMQYDKSNTIVGGLLSTVGDSICQKTSSPANTYASLQESSCVIVHNATAYKKALYDVTLQKQDLLKKATKIIMDSSLLTLGESDARNTMLLELQLLYQGTVDDFKFRLNNADMQVQIARDTETYAAQATSFGVNSSVLMEATKGVIGLAIIGGTTLLAPYNE